MRKLIDIILDILDFYFQRIHSVKQQQGCFTRKVIKR